jgi:hypothetical protein
MMGRVGRVGVLAMVLWSGCSGNPSQPSPFRLGEPFDVRIGARVEVDDDSFLMFDDVRVDSRCPVDAQCVRAGEAVVSVIFGTRSIPPPRPGTITITIAAGFNDFLIIDGVAVPPPWCTSPPGTLTCRLTTSEGKSTATAGAYTIRLIGLAPVPRAGTPIARGDYVGTFVVSR